MAFCLLKKIPVKPGLNGLKASYAPGRVSEQDKLSAVKTTKMKSSKANFVTWTSRLPPKRQLSILLNFFFPFIDIGYFSQVLNFNSVELNRFAKQAKL